jgi:cellulose synthase/poly-beta-1,6-N-acetylglucosamine synthase-like glycosyltransferase
MRQLVRPSGVTTAIQVALTVLLSLVLPFLVLAGFFLVGIDISSGIHLGLLAVLLIMATMQWAEAIKALAPVPLPPASADPAPAASGVIAAYLPNEADTIVETIEAFLRLRYSGPLQIVLAYNTPTDLPVEDDLRAIAQRDPRLLLVRVPNSKSKSQNVNYVIPLLTGQFVGIFDADHHPAEGAFERARRWIDDGADVVQGHCVIRNGDESAVARLVATEFEQIYAVSHPGRQRLHGFGVFGGSNGFWQIQALRETRFRTDFLTEDIEASIRAVRRGRRIVNDPGLVSRELAPTSISQLWRQRMRWAQGWLQVSIRHGHGSPISSTLGARQRFGLGALLLWREVYPWFSSLMWPLIAFYLWRDGGLSFGSSLLLLITVYTLVNGPVQILVARRLSVPEIRSRTAWWWAYGLSTFFFYSEWKNLIARVAQVKQLLGEHQWVVTPRSAPRPTPAAVIEETVR